MRNIRSDSEIISSIEDLTSVQKSHSRVLTEAEENIKHTGGMHKKRENGNCKLYSYPNTLADIAERARSTAYLVPTKGSLSSTLRGSRASVQKVHRRSSK